MAYNNHFYFSATDSSSYPVSKFGPNLANYSRLAEIGEQQLIRAEKDDDHSIPLVNISPKRKAQRWLAD